MLSGGLSAAGQALTQFGERLSSTDFSPLALLLAVGGLGVEIRRNRWLLPAALLTDLVVVANYHPSDWYVFFLSSYPLIGIAAGIGLARALDWWQTIALPQHPQINRYAGPLLAAVAVAIALGPTLSSRIPALRQGIALFSEESYVYPVEDPAEPRRIAEEVLQVIPDEAVLVWDWRSLYSIAYVAYAEGRKPGIMLYEATPHGSEGRVADTLLETVDAALAAGQRVYVDSRREDFRGRYRLAPLGGGQLYELTAQLSH
jgi:hypothetical protein